MSNLRDELRKLGASSLVYIVPTFVARGLAFVLSPVYAAVLGPAEFGVVGFATTLAPLLSTLFGCGAAGSAHRLHHDFPDETERKRFFGSIVAFVVAAPLVLAVVVDRLVARFGSPFASLPYEPYGQLVLWTGAFGVVPSAFLSIYVAREKPRTVAIYNVLSVLSAVGFTVAYVVVLRHGAVGQLRAGLISSVINALLALLLLRKIIAWPGSWKPLRSALAYGVPLVPHQLSNWALAASDRAILERYVTREDLGRYSLGYTFGTVTSFVGVAIGLALGPMIHRRLKAQANDSAVPKIASLALLVTIFVGLEVALLGGPAIQLVTSGRYRGAEAIVPWISAAYVFQALYQVLSLGTLFSKRTASFPFITALAAMTNIGLNLVFVPRFGIVAAAVTTFLAYVILAAAHGILAKHMFPIAWEYGRLLRMGAAAAITFAVGMSVAESGVAALLVRAAVSLLFPPLLVALGAVSRSEVAAAWSAARRRLGAVR